MTVMSWMIHSVKKLFFDRMPEVKEVPKTSKPKASAYIRYASPSVCAVSQNILQSKLFRSKKIRIIGVDYAKIERMFSPIFQLCFDGLGFFDALKNSCRTIGRSFLHFGGKKGMGGELYDRKSPKVLENFTLSPWFSNFSGVIIKSNKHRGRFALGILSAGKEFLSKEVVVVKRLFAMLVLLLIVFSLGGCVFSHVNRSSDVTLHFHYADYDVEVQLPREEAERVTEILDWNLYDPLGGSPACGFDRDISLQVGNRRFAIALDQCNCVADYAAFRYFDIPKEGMAYIHSLFEKYCGFEEYGGFY